MRRRTPSLRAFYWTRPVTQELYARIMGVNRPSGKTPSALVRTQWTDAVRFATSALS
jgi:hypothetical protein